jgi:hypothetical protein
LDQLGTNGVALEIMAWMYFGVSAPFSLLLVAGHPPLTAYSVIFLSLTAVFLLIVLLPETANSLVNPAEGLVLMHQPINGATYTAAKLAHLARIILYLVTGLRVVPALAGLALKGSGWSYPFLYMSAAFATGLVDALLCCALFGWLVRLIPPRRLKAAAQLIGTLPFMAMSFVGPSVKLVARTHIHSWPRLSPLSGGA